LANRAEGGAEIRIVLQAAAAKDLNPNDLEKSVGA
jgi:hypothetical protein